MNESNAQTDQIEISLRNDSSILGQAIPNRYPRRKRKQPGNWFEVPSCEAENNINLQDVHSEQVFVVLDPQMDYIKQSSSFWDAEFRTDSQKWMDA